MRPTNATMWPSTARPRRCRAACFVASSHPGGGGAKRSRSTPGATTATRSGVRAVQRRPGPGASLGGVRHQPVGLGHHLLLADDAATRLGPVTLGQHGVLDPGQGVHGVHERDAPAVLGQPAHLPGQPVVRVDEVVAARRPSGLGPHHAWVKAHSWPGRSSLARPSNGPAITCRTITPGAISTVGRQVAGGGPGEDLDLDAGARPAGGRPRRCRRSCRRRRRCPAGPAARCARTGRLPAGGVEGASVGARRCRPSCPRGIPTSDPHRLLQPHVGPPRARPRAATPTLLDIFPYCPDLRIWL